MIQEGRGWDTDPSVFVPGSGGDGLMVWQIIIARKKRVIMVWQKKQRLLWAAILHVIVHVIVHRAFVIYAPR